MPDIQHGEVADNFSGREIEYLSVAKMARMVEDRKSGIIAEVRKFRNRVV